MIVLLTNDDGIDAPGIQALERVVPLVFPSATVFVAAPATEMSQVGHRVTTSTPLRVESRGEGRWAVGGTPADCVRLALSGLLPQRSDWVLSGINRGGNLGQDIYISGTVAGAREAAFHGVRSISVSQYVRSGVELCWNRTAVHAASVLPELAGLELGPGEHWNVNLPHLDEGEEAPVWAETHPERAPLPIAFERDTADQHHYRGVYADRPKGAGSDVDICFGGRISVSRLSI